MSLLYQLLNKQEPETPVNMGESVFVDSVTNVGVEIEIENAPSSSCSNLQSWNRVSEGSIQGFELVLNRPHAGDDLFCALNELHGLTLSEGNFTPRTSVHVHIDVRDLTVDQFMNFITLSMMFEPVLYKYVAPHRTHNHFCWQLGECQGIIDKLVSLASNNRRSTRNFSDYFRMAFSVGGTKYAGINLSAVPRYGSLEFRMHEGTAHVPSLIRWINILLSIKAYAKDPERTPINILEVKQDEGIGSIFETVLGGYQGVLSYDGVEDDILKGIRVAQDFVHKLQPHPDPTGLLPSVDNSLWESFRTTIDFDDWDEDEEDEF